MQVHRLNAAAGRRWVAEAFRLCRRAPLPLLGVTMTYLMVLVISASIPVLGAFAPLLLTPILSVGVMNAVRATDQRRGLTPASLVKAFREQAVRAWKPLLLLGVFNVATTVIAFGLSALLDDGVLLEIPTGTLEGDDPRLRSVSLIGSILMFLVVYTPAQMALWYAPLFVAWDQVSPMKALFFSLVAVARNKWAFLNYALSWAGVALVASLVVQILKLVFGDSPRVLSVTLMPISLIMLTAMYCSFWPSYRDAVGATPPASMPPATGLPTA